MRTGFKLLALSFFLMAFQCDEDEQTLFFNKYKTTVTPQAVFSLNDTIWVTGKISSKVYNLETNDSIFYNEQPFRDEFLVMKLINSNPIANCEGALDHFQIINSIGDSYVSICEESDFIAQNALGSDNDFYSYKVGFIPLKSADYVFSFRNATLTNTNRNEYIIQDYPLEESHKDFIGFDRCGNLSWRLLSESDYEFYFSVR